MNNIKKLGLTALAGSLVASSAYAGALDVTGTAKITYVSHDDDEVTGNGLSTNKGIGFAGSGDLDNGMTMSYSYTMTDAAFSTTVVSIDMGDTGSIAVANGTAWSGIAAYDDVMPTAGEEVWDDVDADDNGVVTHANTNMVGYKGTWGGIGISAAYVNSGAANGAGEGGSDSSVVITYDGLMDGLEVGIGTGEDGDTSDLLTWYAKYTTGGVTVGLQRSEVDFVASGTADEERDHIAASFAVNENLSVSYGRSEVDMGADSEDEESSGVSASYTMGSMTLGMIANSTNNVAGATATDDSYKEVSVAFAF